MSADTITAICALVVSVAATSLAVWTALTQRKHMRLSVRPIAAIPVADFENRVGVFLANHGLGPMRVTRVIVWHDESSSQESLIAHMPTLENGVFWRGFHERIDGAVVRQGRRLTLLLLEGDPEDIPFRTSRDAIRETLSSLTVRVEYEDLYGNAMHVQRTLSWFGRHRAQPTTGAGGA